MEKVAEVKEVKVKKNSRRQASARLTSEQWEAFDSAQAESWMSHVEFVRYALMLACKEQGVEFPLNMPEAGKYPRK